MRARSLIVACAGAALALTACGGDDDEQAAAGGAGGGAALPGPVATPDGFEPAELRGTLSQSPACLSMEAGYGPIGMAFPEGWSLAGTQVLDDTGTARAAVGDRIVVQAVVLTELPEQFMACSGVAMQVVDLTTADG